MNVASCFSRFLFFVFFFFELCGPGASLLFFLYESACFYLFTRNEKSTELTERCPQVIEPGFPPRTNPNHPTVSSLVSRVPQSLVSHGCLTTPLSQCTLVSAPLLHITVTDSPLSIWPQTPMSCSSHRWLVRASGKKREKRKIRTSRP